MSLFTRTRPDDTTTEADPQANPDLPDGHDDPNSEWFVAPELRPYYHRSHAAELDLVSGADGQTRISRWMERRHVLAEYERLADEEEARDPGLIGVTSVSRRRYPRNLTDTQRSNVITGSPLYSTPRLKPNAEELELYFHEHRLEVAKRAVQSEAARAAAAKAAEVTHVCEVCRTRFPVEVPWATLPARRSSPSPTSVRGNRRVRACPPCLEALRLTRDEQLMSERVGELTRRELAGRWLEQHR